MSDDAFERVFKVVSTGLMPLRCPANTSNADESCEKNAAADTSNTLRVTRLHALVRNSVVHFAGSRTKLSGSDFIARANMSRARGAIRGRRTRGRHVLRLGGAEVGRACSQPVRVGAR